MSRLMAKVFSSLKKLGPLLHLLIGYAPIHRTGQHVADVSPSDQHEGNW